MTCIGENFRLDNRTEFKIEGQEFDFDESPQFLLKIELPKVNLVFCLFVSFFMNIFKHPFHYNLYLILRDSF